MSVSLSSADDTEYLSFGELTAMTFDIIATVDSVMMYGAEEQKTSAHIVRQLENACNRRLSVKERLIVVGRIADLIEERVLPVFFYDNMQQLQLLMGQTCIGPNLPRAWHNSQTWFNPTNTLYEPKIDYPSRYVGRARLKCMLLGIGCLLEPQFNFVPSVQSKVLQFMELSMPFDFTPAIVTFLIEMMKELTHHSNRRSGRKKMQSPLDCLEWIEEWTVHDFRGNYPEVDRRHLVRSLDSIYAIIRMQKFGQHAHRYNRNRDYSYQKIMIKKITVFVLSMCHGVRFDSSTKSFIRDYAQMKAEQDPEEQQRYTTLQPLAAMHAEEEDDDSTYLPSIHPTSMTVMKIDGDDTFSFSDIDLHTNKSWEKALSEMAVNSEDHCSRIEMETEEEVSLPIPLRNNWHGIPAFIYAKVEYRVGGSDGEPDHYVGDDGNQITEHDLVPKTCVYQTDTMSYELVEEQRRDWHSIGSFSTVSSCDLELREARHYSEIGIWFDQNYKSKERKSMLAMGRRVDGVKSIDGSYLDLGSTDSDYSDSMETKTLPSCWIPPKVDPQNPFNYRCITQHFPRMFMGYDTSQEIHKTFRRKPFKQYPESYKKQGFRDDPPPQMSDKVGQRRAIKLETMYSDRMLLELQGKRSDSISGWQDSGMHLKMWRDIPVQEVFLRGEDESTGSDITVSYWEWDQNQELLNPDMEGEEPNKILDLDDAELDGEEILEMDDAVSNMDFDLDDEGPNRGWKSKKRMAGYSPNDKIEQEELTDSTDGQMSVEKWNYEGITGHEWNSESDQAMVQVKWETGEITWEILKIFAMDAYEECFKYAKTHELIHTRWWMSVVHQREIRSPFPWWENPAHQRRRENLSNAALRWRNSGSLGVAVSKNKSKQIVNNSFIVLTSFVDKGQQMDTSVNGEEKKSSTDSSVEMDYSEHEQKADNKPVTEKLVRIDYDDTFSISTNSSFGTSNDDMHEVSQSPKQI